MHPLASCVFFSPKGALKVVKSPKIGLNTLVPEKCRKQIIFLSTVLVLKRRKQTGGIVV